MNAIVNCADPTLMGSDSNVDGAIHRGEMEKQENKNNLKDIFRGRYYKSNCKIFPVVLFYTHFKGKFFIPYKFLSRKAFHFGISIRNRNPI